MNILTSTTKIPTVKRSLCGSVEGNYSDVFTDIFRDDINITIWQRALGNQLLVSAENILDKWPTLKICQIVTHQGASKAIEEIFGFDQEAAILSKDIAQLVDMFCYLFDLKHAGLRLTTLNHAMCPRFHVDRILCRLITTYQGVATEWLPNLAVNRGKLGTGNRGEPDERSGLLDKVADIRQLSRGDVALLKGEAWAGNGGAGLVHRSPKLPRESRRLLLTLDFVNN